MSDIKIISVTIFYWFNGQQCGVNFSAPFAPSLESALKDVIAPLVETDNVPLVKLLEADLTE